MHLTVAQFYDARTNRVTSDFHAVRSLVKGARNVLEVGSGTGRIVKDLLDKGIQRIVGVESDREKWNIAFTRYGKIPGVEMVNDDFLEFYSKERFDRILFAFNVLAEFIEIPNRVLAIKRAKSLLSENGRIVLLNFLHDFGTWQSPESHYEFPINDERIGNWKCSITCLRDVINQISRCKIVYSTPDSPLQVTDKYSMALITRNELLTLFEAMDLEVSEEYGSLGLDPLTEGSDMMIHAVRQKP